MGEEGFNLNHDAYANSASFTNDDDDDVPSIT